MPKPRPLAKALCAVLLLVSGWTRVAATEPEPPLFSGYMSSGTSGSLFALRWRVEDGSERQGWLRVGSHAGRYRLVGFDVKTEILSVEDTSGRRFPLRLPEGKVRAEELTEADYQELFSYTMQGADTSRAPVLSREKARIFYLEKIQRMFRSVADVQVVFDTDGRTLPPERAATWASDQARAKAAGMILLAVLIDGKTVVNESPRRPFPMPEPMIRNLTESDWDEIGLLVATNSFRGRLKRNGQSSP